MKNTSFIIVAVAVAFLAMAVVTAEENAGIENFSFVFRILFPDPFLKSFLSL